MFLLGRRIPVAETEDGLRAIAKGEIVKPERFEKYLVSKFGEHLATVREDMHKLAQSVPPAQLKEQAFHLYERFRSEVPSGESGWGAKGVLDVAKIDALDEGPT